MTGLRVVLSIMSIACLCAFVAVIIPWEYLSKIIAIRGWDISAFRGIEKYFVRLGFAGFGFIGIFFLILAKDPYKYPAMVSLGGYGLLTFGFFCLGWGFYYGFEIWIWFGDAAFCWIFGSVILFMKDPEEPLDNAKENIENSPM
ncbi:MAG: hypothetical protein GY855_16250 [candidate division Zixibacteria bacterium]|nr:hypothetical protein [candidate division Zixibacteria bacterium]